MDPRYRVKRGDVPGVLRGTCSDAAGPVDLSSATEVRLLIRGRASGVAKVSAPVTVLDDGTLETRGRWERPWAGPDLDTAGTFDVEVQATWPDGTRLTFPTTGAAELIVERDLGS